MSLRGLYFDPFPYHRCSGSDFFVVWCGSCAQSGGLITTLPIPRHLQGSLSRATQEQKQLSEKLREEAEQKEQLRRMKNEMENERWHLDKTIEKLQKEVREQGRGERVEGGSRERIGCGIQLLWGPDES